MIQQRHLPRAFIRVYAIYDWDSAFSGNIFNIYRDVHTIIDSDTKKP